MEKDPRFSDKGAVQSQDLPYDFHSRRLTRVGDGQYDTDGINKGQIGVLVTSGIAVHVALPDPHTQYRLESADHNHQSTGLQSGQLDHGLAMVAASLLDDDHTQYQKESEKDAASGYAGLNASSRTTKGVDTTDDVIIDLATKGLVLKDTQGTPHYWRVTVSVLGVLTTADLGVAKP